MQSEIERKFLVSNLPAGEEAILLSVVDITQTYIGVGSGDELRVRRLVDRDNGETTYTFAFKKGNGVSRLEFEEEVSQELYQSVVGNLAVKPLKKTRTTYNVEGSLIEVDKYQDFDFIVAEVEFADEGEMQSFTPPAWCSEDISGIKKYSNKKLWAKLQ
jgi:CYTH domain-containing protein